MKTQKLVTVAMLIIAGLFTNQMYSQSKEKNMKLKTINYEVEVNVSPEKAWTVLAEYGNVASFHSGVISSTKLNGSQDQAVLGCDRECVLPNGKKTITVKEKIIDIQEGKYYKYNVYDWENFPLNTMINTFGVKVNGNEKTIIYQISEYRLKPGFLTGLMKGKLKGGMREVLISYKHYMETGEKNVDVRTLKKKYKSL